VRRCGNVVAAARALGIDVPLPAADTDDTSDAILSAADVPVDDSALLVSLSPDYVEGVIAPVDDDDDDDVAQAEAAAPVAPPPPAPPMPGGGGSEGGAMNVCKCDECVDRQRASVSCVS
jgi:hypothetical protein